MASTPDDRGYLDALYRQYGMPVWRMLLRLTGRADVASDITQQTFIQLAKRGDLAALENQRQYLFRIARNTLHEHREREAMDARVASHVAETLIEPNNSEERAVELAEALRRAFDHMTERQREVIRLWVLVQDYRVVAETLGVSDAVVGQDLSHARQKIKAELKS